MVKLSDIDRRSKVAYVRVTPKELEDFTRVAEAEKLTLSEWLRRLGKKRTQVVDNR